MLFELFVRCIHPQRLQSPYEYFLAYLPESHLLCAAVQADGQTRHITGRRFGYHRAGLLYILVFGDLRSLRAKLDHNFADRCLPAWRVRDLYLAGWTISTAEREDILERNSCVCIREPSVGSSSSVLDTDNSPLVEWTMFGRTRMVWLGSSIRQPTTHARCSRGRSCDRSLCCTDTFVYVRNGWSQAHICIPGCSIIRTAFMRI